MEGITCARKAVRIIEICIIRYAFLSKDVLKYKPKLHSTYRDIGFSDFVYRPDFS
jgi:hypothetical protein